MLTSPPEALSMFRFKPERKMPAGVSAVGAAVGGSVQAPHSSGHCRWSEKASHSPASKRSQKTSVLRQAWAAAGPKSAAITATEKQRLERIVPKKKESRLNTEKKRLVESTWVLSQRLQAFLGVLEGWGVPEDRQDN